MPFEFTSRVRYSETDPEEKLTLVSLVDYFQDASTFQSEDCGVGTRFLKKQDLAWMILSWQIEILRRPYLAEPITAQTWPYGFKAFYGYRNYALVDAGKNYLAKANSVWALIDLQTGKPVRVAEEHVARYKMEEKLDMEYGPRKLKLPQDCVKREPFTVCRYHLDTNNHVNNGQYIRMAEEYLPEGFETGYLQVEYKKQAHLHDVIYPYVHQDAQTVTVGLCDEAGKPYAVLSHRAADSGSDKAAEKGRTHDTGRRKTGVNHCKRDRIRYLSGRAQGEQRESAVAEKGSGRGDEAGYEGGSIRISGFK